MLEESKFSSKPVKQAAIGRINSIRPLNLKELEKKPKFDGKFYLIATLGKTETSKTYLAQDAKKPSNKQVVKVYQVAGMPLQKLT